MGLLLCSVTRCFKGDRKCSGMLNKLKYSVIVLIVGNAVLFLGFLAYPRATQLWRGEADADPATAVLPPGSAHIKESNATSFNRNLLSLPKEARTEPVDRYSDTCKTPCFKFLSAPAKKRYALCAKRVHDYGVEEIQNNGCKFMNASGRENVALASFPGSGNTWLRGILEQATGVCTGASMCDMSLRAGGFTGEGVDTQSVLVVKTHRASSTSWKEAGCDSAIVIIRNPLHALVSEYNRLVANNFSHQTIALGTHTNRAGKAHFGENPKWQEFLDHKMQIWRYFILHWLITGTKTKHRILVVRYEDVKAHKLEKVKTILRFLHFPFQEDNLNATLSQEYGTYHREHTEDFDPFTAVQRGNVMTMIRKTQTALRNYHLSHLVKLSDYLEPPPIYAVRF